MDGNAFDNAWLRRFRTAIRNWYARHARDLPWRRTTDPYRIWISEIMLQQTTVKAVIPYFVRFIASFPTVRTLAAANEDDVFRHWEGLGYYSRARNLHNAARVIVSEYNGQFPNTVDTLLKLPGIGRYTAGAIASFAFDVPAPIVEANTLRLYCRLLGYSGDPRSRDGQTSLWDFASHILPRKSPGRFNQALMELGATVCTPTNPGCEECPVRSCCRAFADGSQHEIPQLAKRPDVTRVTEATVAVRKGKQWLLRKRGAGERWAGLWDFPRFELNANGSKPSAASVAKSLESRLVSLTGMTVELGDCITEIEHSVTRFRIRLLCYVGEHRAGTVSRAGDLKWVPAANFESFPLSVTGRKFAKLLEKLPS